MPEDVDMHTCLRPLQNLSNTLFMLPPFSMDMILVWSSSLIQIRKFFSLLCLRQSRGNRWFWGPSLKFVFFLFCFFSQVSYVVNASTVSGLKAEMGRRRRSEQHFFIKKGMIIKLDAITIGGKGTQKRKMHFRRMHGIKSILLYQLW